MKTFIDQLNATEVVYINLDQVVGVYLNGNCEMFVSTLEDAIEYIDKHQTNDATYTVEQYPPRTLCKTALSSMMYLAHETTEKTIGSAWQTPWVRWVMLK